MAEIDWFNVETGERVYTKRPAQIKALINSSDLGVNRQSDKGWRLGKEWVKKLRAAYNDKALMSELSKASGGEVTDVQVLIALFDRESAAEKQAEARDNIAPFEQEYLESLKEQPVKQVKNSN